MSNSLLKKSLIDKVIESKDKEIVLKVLLNDGVKNLNTNDFGLTIDWEQYQEGLKKRTGFTFEGITKSIKNFSVDLIDKKQIEEINEEDIEKVFQLIDLKKALDVSNILQGLVFGTSEILEDLYYSSYCLLNWFIDNFKDEKYKDWVKLINKYLFALKSLKDSLSFVKFENGNIIQSVSKKVKQEKLKKYFEDYVSSYEIQEVNEIYEKLTPAIQLLKALYEAFPEDESLNDLKSEISNTLKIVESFNKEFPSMVMSANQLNVIYVEPKEVTQSSKPKLEPIFYEATTKKITLGTNDKKDWIFLFKNTDNVQGLITGVVLAPDIVDLQKQSISAEIIEKAMIGYMENSQMLGLMHETFNKNQGTENPDFRLIENYIAPQDLTINEQIVVKGTWIQTWKILNEEIKKKVFDGTYNGFSIGGTALVNPS